MLRLSGSDYTSLVGRGGFEALPTSTALYFKGIHDYAPTMPQANFSFILYIFFSILRVKSSPYPVRDSKPINKPLKAFISKAFSGLRPNNGPNKDKFIEKPKRISSLLGLFYCYYYAVSSLKHRGGFEAYQPLSIPLF